MRIGGYQPVSLSDYPGRIAAVVFTQGCNFRCPFCHNRRLWPDAAHPGQLLAEAEVLERLDRRRGKLDSVVISGGEPTLQPDLACFLSKVRRLGFAVKLDTNGSRPDVLRELLAARLLDFVAMDIKAPWHKYELLAGVAVNTTDIATSMQMLAASGIPHEFRTTVPPGLLNEDDLAGIRAILPPGSPHRRQSYRRVRRPGNLR
ncbi:MAG: anaerobic ribonucleoside-triphosphate reductase activating protein [Bryobacterales bacterium]|nr:anaerobic ribonucleoside-triphosphate reductase activating protein [Bryobacteraceae bacterium]MDW8130921.1 anaerobic ribonucleoside-triphosphate reductase activating protein [Bryobacterales bacterium]